MRAKHNTFLCAAYAMADYIAWKSKSLLKRTLVLVGLIVSLRGLHAYLYPAFDFGEATTYTMGFTATKLIPGGEGPNPTAYARCGADICRLSFENGHETGLDISTIWLTDFADPAIEQPFLFDIAIQPRVDEDDFGNPDTLICITHGRVLFAQIDDYCKTVPRYLLIEGTPSRAIFCQRLDCSITASVKDEILRSGLPQFEWKGDRQRTAQI